MKLPFCIMSYFYSVKIIVNKKATNNALHVNEKNQCLNIGIHNNQGMLLEVLVYY